MNTVKKNKKITIVALHLGFGGVENSIISLANMLSQKNEVEIISTYKLLEKPAFFVNDNIKITYLLDKLKPNKEELKNAIKSKNILNILKEACQSIRVIYLRKYKFIKAVKKVDSDIIISTRYMHNKWVGRYAKKSIIKIAQEHNHHNNNKKYIHKVIKSLKHIDYLMPVSQELTAFYSEKLKNTKTKVMFIPNALDYFPKSSSSLQSKSIISVGRLAKEKGFLDLIEVFKEIHSNNAEAKLRIVGDGNEREIIKAKIAEYKLEDSIIMCGTRNKKEIETMMLESSIYLMTSFTESFGIALVEAGSFGIPAIAFDSAQGAKEIIINNKNGFLIKNRNIKEMAEKTCDLLNNFEKRQYLGKNAREFSKKYTKEVISLQWYNFIDKL